MGLIMTQVEFPPDDCWDVWLRWKYLLLDRRTVGCVSQLLISACVLSACVAWVRVCAPVHNTRRGRSPLPRSPRHGRGPFTPAIRIVPLTPQIYLACMRACCNSIVLLLDLALTLPLPSISVALKFFLLTSLSCSLPSVYFVRLILFFFVSRSFSPHLRTNDKINMDPTKYYLWFKKNNVRPKTSPVKCEFLSGDF